MKLILKSAPTVHIKTHFTQNLYDKKKLAHHSSFIRWKLCTKSFVLRPVVIEVYRVMESYRNVNAQFLCF